VDRRHGRGGESTGNTSASLLLAGRRDCRRWCSPSGGIAMEAGAIAYGRARCWCGGTSTIASAGGGGAPGARVYLLNSINPFRLEGQKTIVLELLLQLGWQSPDWIAVPAGNLGNTAAFGKALREAKALGLITKVPRIALVQASGAAPFATAFAEDFAVRRRVRAETVATAIKIGDPASWDRAVRAIRETNGVVLAVSDAEILEAKAVIDASGVGCEPASAASVAGVRRLVAEGTIRPGEQVVAVLTGHVLKDPGMLLRYHQDTEPPPARANRPVEIDPDLKAVERLLRGP
jgi:threonine synthase